MVFYFKIFKPKLLRLIMDIFGLSVEWLGHDCFKIKNEKIIYFDPYQIFPQEPADLILISHEHFDHCSISDLRKIVKSSTVVIAAVECKNKLKEIEKEINRIIYLTPGQRIAVNAVIIEAIAAYNVNKFYSPGIPFHPQADKKIGFVVTFHKLRIYHAGDTDLIPEMRMLKNIDIAFLPVSGTYVMTAEEAAKAVEEIKPRVAIPMHYGTIVGSKADANRFKELIKTSEVKIFS